MLAAEARRQGKGFNAREYSSGSMFPDAEAAYTGQPQRGGAQRPLTSGLRKAQPPAATGPRGAFVPPFVKKAMAAQNGEQEEGPLSSKTLEMLAGLLFLAILCPLAASMLSAKCCPTSRLSCNADACSFTANLVLSACACFAGPDGELPEALQKVDPNILELVCNEILDKRSGIQWEDIAGQQDAKSLVQELVVWPMLNPHLFTVSLCVALSLFLLFKI